MAADARFWAPAVFRFPDGGMTGGVRLWYTGSGDKEA